jgi:hypothetical protein
MSRDNSLGRRRRAAALTGESVRSAENPPPAIEQSDSIKTQTRKARALARFRQLGTVRSACIAAGIGRRTWYDWLEEDRAFAALVYDARDDVVDELEKAAFQRAIDGSDGLLMFLLKAFRPSKYRDALKIDMVSPIVKEKLAQTVNIIRTHLPRELAEPLLEKLSHVWR